MDPDPQDTVRNISFHPLGSGSVIILYRSADPRIATILLIRLVSIFFVQTDPDPPVATILLIRLVGIFLKKRIRIRWYS